MTRRSTWIVAAAVLAIGLTPLGAALATEAPEQISENPQLEAGREVYESICAACHQPDGRGVPGAFPPLLDNPRVDDAAYVENVIRNGLQGEIEVNGETYNGVMPAFGSLSDEEIAAVIVYVQEGLGAPAPPTTPGVAPPAAADDGLPLAAVLAFTLGFLIFGAAVVVVLRADFAATRSKGTFSTGQVWLKSVVIFVYFVVATVFIPSMVVEAGFLASPPAPWEDVFSADLWSTIRDLIAAGVWLAALLAGMWALRMAQRRELI